jgi:hypothetical protein
LTELFDEDLASAQKILETYRRNRRHLAERQAEQGGALAVADMNQLRQIEEQITAYKAEVARLKTKAVVEQYPLAEAKFRELLAETWDTERGSPTTVGLERLERARLELGIKQERARELATDIRARLARETFYSINHQLLVHFDETLSAILELGSLPDDYSVPSHVLLRQLGKAIRLHVQTAGSLFIQAFMGPISFNREALAPVLIVANIWFDSDEKSQFQLFLKILPVSSTDS